MVRTGVFTKKTKTQLQEQPEGQIQALKYDLFITPGGLIEGSQ